MERSRGRKPHFGLNGRRGFRHGVDRFPFGRRSRRSDRTAAHLFARRAAREACGEPAGGGDVVVCGRKEAEEQYRLRPLARSEIYEPKPVRAQVGVGGGSTLGITVQDKEMTPGQRSQRAMVTLSTPF